MAFNLKDHYFQDTMTVLSSTTPEPGQKQETAPVSEKIRANGLYRFVSLIKGKFKELFQDLNRFWTLGGSGMSRYQAEITRWQEEPQNDLNNYYVPGNYWTRGLSNQPVDGKIPTANILNTPENRQYAAMLKVSTFGGATGYMQQDYIEITGNRRYHRYGTNVGGTGQWVWTPWLLVLDTGVPDGEGGSADELFLKRKNDYTIGPTGFGRNPLTGEDVSTNDKEGKKSKIVLGTYNYGPESPDEHYNKIAYKDEDIPDGQLYFQYFSVVEEIIEGPVGPSP